MSSRAEPEHAEHERAEADHARPDHAEPEHAGPGITLHAPVDLRLPEVPDLGPDAATAELIRRALAVSTVRLLRHDAGVRLGTDPEDVHDARVATRRLRSTLRAFGDVLDQGWTGALRTELRWLGDALGAVRDAEVLRDRLSARRPILRREDRPDADLLVERLERVRAGRRTQLLEAMGSARYTALADALVDAASEPRVLDAARDVPARSTLVPILQARWQRLRNAIERARDDQADRSLHAARIRAKQVRYAAEAAAPVFGERANGFVEAAAGLQAGLGEHQDAVVAEAWLRQGAEHGAEAFVAGFLAAAEAQAALDARRAWPSAWKRLKRKRLRFWT